MTMDEIVEQAMAYSCTVVVAQPNQLQFDLDDEGSLKRFAWFYGRSLFARFGDKLPREHWKSKSGNDHWTITLPEELSVHERIAMQACGGSDLGREWAALQCHNAGSPHPILLFKPNL